MTSRTPILYIHQDGVISGSAISLANLLSVLDRGRFEPRLILCGDGPARQLFEPLVESIDVICARPFRTQPGFSPRHPDYWRNFKALSVHAGFQREIERRRPALVHVNDKSALSAGLAAHAAGVPVIWHLRSTYAGSRSDFQCALSRRALARSGSFGIAISCDEVEGFDRHFPVEVIHNTVDQNEARDAVARRLATRARLGILDDEILIVMVGQLTDTKGAWDFIRAAGRVRSRLPGHKLCFAMIAPIPPRTISTEGWSWRGRLALRLGMIDTTNAAERATALARDTGIDTDLRLLGREPDVLGVLAAADIATACFRLSAIGRPALEAMSVGTPVIVNAGHTGSDDVVQNGVNGFAVRAGDDGALADAMVRLIAEPELRRSISQRALNYAVDYFDANKNARLIESIYLRLVGRKEKRIA